MTYLLRKLWFVDGEGQHRLEQDDLLLRSRPIVVLGEPGMGKTKLLQTISEEEGNAYCRAQQLINRVRPEPLLGSATTLVIDALDEVSAQADGDAVDLVLRKLGELNYPRFILGCRVGEWRSATSVQAIHDQYEGSMLLEAHLEPLDRNDQHELLAQLTGDKTRAYMLIEHFECFGAELLGNPQTLELIAALPSDQPLPVTSGALFEQAIETLRKERNPLKQELPKEVVLDAAGAAFAGLILSGHARIVDQPSGAVNDADKALPLVEIEAFDQGYVRQAANTKLFAADRDGLTYVHRRVGEFVGARWLAARANTRAKRHRLLGQFRSQGLVPASLRGLHAWLARDPQLATAVIDADPMGVVEYGDADALKPEQARCLFEALERLAVDNPRFMEWQEHRAKALVMPSLMGEVSRVLSDCRGEFAFRILLLHQLKGAPSAAQLSDLLRARILDDCEVYAIRHASALVLVEIGGEDWPSRLEELRRQAQPEAVRLAFELLDETGIGMLSDEQIVEIVLARDGLSVSAVPPPPERNEFGGLYRLARLVPKERLDNLLDTFADYVEVLLPKHVGIEENELIDLVYALILKRLEEGGSVDPLRLWRWLRVLGEQTSYRRDHGRKVAAWLEVHDEVRQTIQQHVLKDVPSDLLWRRAVLLVRTTSGLELRQQDVIALLATLDPANRNDERWRDVLRLGKTCGEEGKALRTAAKSFALHRPDLLAWVEGLAEPRVPDWQLKLEEKTRQREAKRAALFAEQRRKFLGKLDGLKAGHYGLILVPAQAYLSRFHDLGDNVPAHERVAQWLGQDVAAAAHEGFEAFLQARPPRPSAKEMSLSYAHKKHWPAGDIIVSALAERVRTRCEPFEGVSSERLTAGLFECWHSAIEHQAGLKELGPKIEAELKRRGKWKKVVQLYIRPQLRLRLQHVHQLWALMTSDEDGVMTDLTEDWLTRYSDLPTETECVLIDRLVRSNRRETLRVLLAERLARDLDNDRRRDWEAIALVVDFDAARKQLGDAIDPELLWHLRARLGDRRRDKKPHASLSVDQLAWTITIFRKHWPQAIRPSSVTTGDTNPWDASEYIRMLITRLGNHVSDDAVAAITKLRNAPEDDYTWFLRTVSAEQRQKRADESYTPPTLNQIKAVLDGGPPASVADLRAIVVEELQELKKRLRGSSEDDVDLYWTDAGKPRIENECRDRTVALLRGYLAPLSIFPADEADMPADKRADIVFQHGGLLLPVEAKRQQHPDLWTAINDQLEAFYTGHWQAEGQGLFLVFWFGSSYLIPTQPGGLSKPTTAAELQVALSRHPAVTAGRVDVMVLDLER